MKELEQLIKDLDLTPVSFSKNRQIKIENDILEVEKTIEDIKTKIKFFNTEANFCPYRLGEQVLILQKQQTWLQIFKRL